MRFIDKFKAVFLDMNGTFMFEADRLDARQDFYATYLQLGGRRLGRKALHDAVLRVCAELQRNYKTFSLSDSFPSVSEAVSRYGNVESNDQEHIEQVIAAHEVGVVPTWASQTIKALSATHDIAVVSNIWSRAYHWRSELSRAGIVEASACMVFSSEIGSIKPSSKPFLRALHLLDHQPQNVLFVGDSLERDIRPAKSLGMSTAWISTTGADPTANHRIKSIMELL